MILAMIYPFQNFYVSGTTYKETVFEIYQCWFHSLYVFLISKSGYFISKLISVLSNNSSL